MKRIILLTLCAVAAYGQNNLSPRSTAGGCPSSIELLELRTELYRQGTEFEDWKIKHLKEELDAAVLDRERSNRAQAALLNDLTTPDQEAGEIASRKEEISGTDLPRAEEVRQAAIRRVETVAAQLETAERRRQSLAELIAEVKP